MPNEEVIFNEARRIDDPAARAAYLAEACGRDESLRSRIESLLNVHEKQASFLGSPAPGLEPDLSLDPPILLLPAGTVIGRYKLLEPIGEGGYGVVFMAEQTSPVQRKVALKIIKAGMDTRQVIARFEAERQALALMDHPNIAKVFDAGTTDTGRLYFVMELVKGVPITKYCDEHHIEPRQRLELFMQVCQAVQHAHQKGIIHRDIKPSNVLVAQYDGKPVPKVIDFGVAKATGQQLTDLTMFTGFGDVIGTLEYMSPEQAEVNQLDVDTRSDIYSLGVLLYELLTGSTPLEHKRVMKAGLLEMLRLVREEEPPKPSTRLTTTAELPSIAACRGLEPKKLSGLVKGELDWIVMKSLEKDRNRRYETANGLASDVQRYLNDEAVQACPPSTWYRFRKIARRNKTSLLTAGLLAAMLLAGVVLLAVNNVRLKAEQARTRAELTRADGNLGVALTALDKIFMTAIEDRVNHDRKLSGDDRRLLESGLAFYEQFAARNSAHAGLQTETARAHRRVGVFQLGLTHWPEAESAFRRAIPVFESIQAQSPGFAEYRRELAFCFEGLSRALWQQQRTDEANKAAERALPLWEALAAGATTQKDDRFNLAHCLGHQAMLLAHDRRYDEAERTYTRVLDLFAKLKNEFPQDRGCRQEWAFTHAELAYWVLRPTKRLPEAEQHYREAIAAYRALAEEAPDDSWYPRCQANELHNLGDVFKEVGQSTAAEKLYRQAIELQENTIARGPPLVNEHRHLLAFYVGDLARFLRDCKRLSEAEEGFRRSLTIRQTMIADLVEPDDQRERENQRRLRSADYVELIQTLYLAAERAAADEAQPDDERKAAATRFRARAREIQRDATRAGHLGADGLNNLAWSLVVKPDSSAEDVACAVEIASKAVELAPTNGTFWNTLGVAQYRAGEWNQSVADLEKSTQLRKGGSSHDFFFLAMAHWRLGNKAEARKWYGQAVEWMEKNQPQNEELHRFRTEAAELLKISDAKLTTKPQLK